MKITFKIVTHFISACQGSITQVKSKITKTY